MCDDTGTNNLQHYVSTSIRPTFDSHSTATRPRYDRSTTYVTVRPDDYPLWAAALQVKQAVRVATRYVPAPLLPPVGAKGPRAPPSRRNVAVVSHAQYVLTVTAADALRVKAAVSKAVW